MVGHRDDLPKNCEGDSAILLESPRKPLISAWAGQCQIGILYQDEQGGTELLLRDECEFPKRTPWQGACPSQATIQPTQTQARPVAGARAILHSVGEVLDLFNVAMRPLRAAGTMRDALATIRV